MIAAQWIANLLIAYAVTGLVFAALFLVRGVSTVDPGAARKGGPIGFRLLILPGVAGLWPVMLAKWIRASRAAGGHP